MKLTWGPAFSGIRPKVDAQLLPDGNAQVAENVETNRGGLRGFPGMSDVVALNKPNTKTIYRFGQSLQSANQFWFHWDTDVDVVKGPVDNDTSERTYWTGDGSPRYTTAAYGTSGSNLPSDSWILGIANPTTPAALAASGTPATGATNETRVYVYTFVTALGEESAPSPPSSVIIQTGQSVTLSGMETVASNGALVSRKRVYRAQRGVYLFVGEIASTASGMIDELASDQLGESCPSILWDTPPYSLYGLKAGVNGMMAALDGYTVRFCEPFRPHAWPQDYSQTVAYPTVGLGHFGASFVVLTTGLPFIMTGNSPANMSVVPAKFYQPCLSKRSIVSAGGDVIWASPDGLVSIGSQGENNLTAELFTPEQWRTQIKPETIIGAWHEGCYVGSYDPGTGRRGFILRPAAQEWIDLPDMAAEGFYRDTVGDALYVLVDDTVKKFRAGPVQQFTWKSQVITTPLTDFVCARVTGEYPITFKLHKDGLTPFTKTVTSDEPFKLPARIARKWEISLSGTTSVLGVVLSTTESDA